MFSSILANALLLTAVTSIATAAPATADIVSDSLEARLIKPNVIHVGPGSDGCDRPGWINVRFADTDEIYGKYAQLTSGVVEQCGNVWRFDPATVNDNKFKVRRGDKSLECNMQGSVPKGRTPRFAIYNDLSHEGIVSPCDTSGIKLICSTDLCEKALLA